MRQPAPATTHTTGPWRVAQQAFADHIAERLSAGEVIADIGQIFPELERQIMKHVKAGRLASWRGRWFPVAGAPFGIGPLKTCYGLPHVAEFWATCKLPVSARATS
jgi:hypothetical protein